MNNSVRTKIAHLKLYNESGILPLKESRQRHKLILFFKIIKGLEHKNSQKEFLRVNI